MGSPGGPCLHIFVFVVTLSARVFPDCTSSSLCLCVYLYLYFLTAVLEVAYFCICCHSVCSRVFPDCISSDIVHLIVFLKSSILYILLVFPLILPLAITGQLLFLFPLIFKSIPVLILRYLYGTGDTGGGINGDRFAITVELIEFSEFRISYILVLFPLILKSILVLIHWYLYGTGDTGGGINGDRFAISVHLIAKLSHRHFYDASTI